MLNFVVFKKKESEASKNRRAWTRKERNKVFTSENPWKSRKWETIKKVHLKVSSAWKWENFLKDCFNIQIQFLAQHVVTDYLHFSWNCGLAIRTVEIFSRRRIARNVRRLMRVATLCCSILSVMRNLFTSSVILASIRHCCARWLNWKVGEKCRINENVCNLI